MYIIDEVVLQNTRPNEYGIYVNILTLLLKVIWEKIDGVRPPVWCMTAIDSHSQRSGRQIKHNIIVLSFFVTRSYNYLQRRWECLVPLKAVNRFSNMIGSWAEEILMIIFIIFVCIKVNVNKP